MADRKPELEPLPAADWPLYWFAALERAVDVGDLESAAKAQRELRRLGVEVSYRGLERREGAHAR